MDLQQKKSAKTTSAAILLAGVFLGALVSEYYSSARDAKGARAQESAMSDAITSQAAPSVSLDARGKARFSRPLEVPPLYAFDSPLGTDELGRQIILVDSQTKRICVYWVRQKGSNSTIELVATRAFELDLKLDDFNGEGLSPGQIREQLEAARL